VHPKFRTLKGFSKLETFLKFVVINVTNQVILLDFVALLDLAEASKDPLTVLWPKMTKVVAHNILSRQ